MKLFSPKGIEDDLFKEGLLTEAQLQEVKHEAMNSTASIEEIILNKNYASEIDIARTKAGLLKIPFIDLSSISLNAEILNFVPETIARKYLLIPFKHIGNDLHVAMADPLDSQVIQFLQQKTQNNIIAYVAATSQIESTISEQYARSLSTDVNAALKETDQTQALGKIDNKNLREDIVRDAPVAKIVSTILEYGLKSRASDIHIEPLEERTRIRYRIDGILTEKLSLPRKVHDAVISRIKILSEMKIDEKRIPQDGRFNFKMNDQEVDLRVSSLPTVHGEKIVMRLLKKSGAVPTLQDLGLRGSALKNFETQIVKPHGIILITGPTGSGKTTTLYAVLTKINTVAINIVTLEDPVEYQMAGVNQVQINPQAGLTFASGLRAFLRQDPNVIMVGEIRDKETAELAIQAALTGHLVFSTIHTNSAAGALPRLLDMGGEPFLIASSVNAIEGQRVVRKICQACREEIDPPEEVIANMRQVLGNLFDAALERGVEQTAEGITNISKKTTVSKAKLYHGRGCPECGGTGYKGRIGIYEVLVVSEKIGKLVLEHAPASTIEQVAREEGMITMKQDGYLKVLEGLTTLEEVLRVAQE
jgi:type IV pilus assembly protein PilB